MQTNRLARKIISLLTMKAMGTGALLGAIYGVIYLPLLSLEIASRFHPQWSPELVDGIVAMASLGLAGGYIIGMLGGLVLGFVSAVLLTLFSAVFMDPLIQEGSYRSLAISLCISTVGASLAPTSILLADASKIGIDWYTLVGVPTLIAMVAFWRIGGSVAEWVEQSFSGAVAGEGA